MSGNPIEINDGWLYWISNDSFMRTPLSFYSASDLEKIKHNLEVVKQPVWKLHSPGPAHSWRVLGEVKFGGDRRAFVFRGYHHASGTNFNGQSILIPQELLAVDDQQRALEFLKSKKRDQPVARENAPRAWFPLNGTESAEPVSLKGNLLNWRIPRSNQTATVFNPDSPPLSKLRTIFRI